VWRGDAPDRGGGELIRARTGEGRKRALERGVRFGRPRKLTPHQQEALARLQAGETQADIARSYAVDATTIGRLHCCTRVRQDQYRESVRLLAGDGHLPRLLAQCFTPPGNGGVPVGLNENALAGAVW
jgi:hypothetical protein